MIFLLRQPKLTKTLLRKAGWEDVSEVSSNNELSHTESQNYADFPTLSQAALNNYKAEAALSRGCRSRAGGGLCAGRPDPKEGETEPYSSVPCLRLITLLCHSSSPGRDE